MSTLRCCARISPTCCAPPGVAVPVERVAWWAQATVAADPAFTGELYWLARVTLVDRPEQIETFDAVFAQVFRGLVDVADFRGEANNAPAPHTEPGEPKRLRRRRRTSG